MSPIELARSALAVAFLAVALYSAARFAWSVTQRGTRIAPAEHVSDISHGLMGLAMALMVAPFGPVLPAAAGVVVFGALAAWFVTILWHDGVMSCAGADDHRRAGGHGGYNLHHLAGCAAVIFMYATGHVIDTTATASAAGAHHELAPITSISWLLGLYFLVAATSLGFRVGESAVRVTHRAALPAGAGFHLPPPPPPAPARLLSSPAGTCASEVILSAGMAFMFFSSL